MTTMTFRSISVTATLALSMCFVSAAHAQSKGTGSIVCWKDAAGKVVGCGDKVPPEYLNSGSQEMDKRGNVRKSGESTEEAAKRKVQEQEKAKAKEEEQKKITEQKRQDSALVNTFTNEKEIDLKRDRELTALDNNITQQRGALKVANDRLAESQQRAAAFDKGNKDKKPAPAGIKDDLARAAGEKARLEKDIAAKEQEKLDTVTKYAAYKKRFHELKGTTPATATAPAATTPAPAPAPATTATAPAPAKK